MKKFFKRLWDFWFRYGGVISSVFYMLCLWTFIIGICVSSSFSIMDTLIASVFFGLFPFISGYNFKRWLCYETNESIVNSNYVYNKIKRIEENLDSYSKEDLIQIMNYFEDYNKSVRELF